MNKKVFYKCVNCPFWQKKLVFLVSDGIESDFLCYNHVWDFRISCQRWLPRVKEVEGLERFFKEKKFVEYLIEVEKCLITK